MTLTNDPAKEIKNGNGATTVFSFGFTINSAEDLVVTFTDSSGNETPLTEGTGTNNYSVSVANYPGNGSITYPATLGTELAAGEKLTIARVVTLDQETDLQNQSQYKPETVEAALDYSRMVDLQQQEQLDRSIKAPISDNSGANYTIPTPTANTVIGVWNATGDAIITGPTADQISSANGSAVAAAASAAAALVSETNAAASEATASAVLTDAGFILVAADLAGADTIGTVATNITNVNAVGSNITNINTVAGIAADVTTVAADGADIGTVAGISADVTTVAGISANVTAVALDSADIGTVAANLTGTDTIGTVATNISNVNTVAGINADVTTVAGISADVTAVAADATDIGTVSTNIANVNAVGGSIANVNTVAADLAGTNTIGTVHTNITNVNNVGGNIANVNTVAGISADVTTVAADGTDIGTVATNIANVNTVAGISSSVTTVAGISADVTTVAADGADIGTVATNIANVNNVGGSIANVNSVAADLAGSNTIGTVSTNIANVNATGGAIANVNIVATNISDVNAVAADATDIGTVATNIANVNAVGTDIANVNTTAGNIANVNTVAGVSANVTTVATNNTNVTTVATNIANVNTVAGISADVTTVAGLSTPLTAAVAGLTFVAQARVATTTNLAYTYNNGTSGVGATLTAPGVGIVSIDGVNIVLNDIVLFKDQTSTFQNGAYQCTTEGTGGATGVFTRITGFDTSAELLDGSIFPIKTGTASTGKIFMLDTVGGSHTMGTDPITFTPLEVSSTGSSVYIDESLADPTTAPFVNATAVDSIAIGDKAHIGATGNDSIAMGWARTVGQYGFSVQTEDNSTDAWGAAALQSICIGPGYVASGSSYSAVLGGDYGQVLGSSTTCVLIGATNDITGASDSSAIISCRLGNIDAGDGDVVVGGALNNIGTTVNGFGYNAILGGSSCSINNGDANVIVGGYGTTIGDSTYYVSSSVAMGGCFVATSDTLGLHNIAEGQRQIIALGRATTNATPVVIDNGIPFWANSRAWFVEAHIVATNIGSSSTRAWKLQCLAKRTSGGTVSIVGTQIKTNIANDAGAAAWDVDFVADNTAKVLDIQVTGNSSGTTRFNCTVFLTDADG